MNINDEIQINQYAQNLVSVDFLLKKFDVLDINKKEMFLSNLLNLTIQSKVSDNDIQEAIDKSNLKASYTPCVMLRKGTAYHLLEKLTKLPENELSKVFILLLSLFKIAYNRRFELEKNNPNKWWYWDLSDGSNIELILKQYK